MKNIIVRIITMILLLMTFFTIFGFSNQDGETSGNVSRKVARKIIEVFPSIRGKSEEKKNKIVEDIQPIVRKMAHFSIYTLVGMLMMIFMNTFSMKLKWKIYISAIVGAIYASSDEIHQSFTPDRTPAITDVIIDTCGVIVGVFIILSIISIYRTLRQEKNQRKLDILWKNDKTT